MRRLALLLALPVLLSPGAASAAGSGVCVDALQAAAVCTPSTVTCGPGDAVTVRVVGFGRGIARCGDVVVQCATLELPYCEQSADVTRAGVLSCEAAPYPELNSTVAICNTTLAST